MNSKFVALLLAFASLAPSAPCAETNDPVTIAVLNVAGPRRTLANNISALVTANLSANPRFVLVDRNELDKVLKEQALGGSGNITPETAARIGRLTGAKVLVTGREFNAGKDDEIVLIANVIGAETGRVFSHTDHGSTSDLVGLVAKLSEKIAQTIGEQSTNLIARPSDARAERLSRIIAQTRGKTLPSVSIRIPESVAGGGASRAAETELDRVFLKAGFTLIDDKSRRQPDILITGDAITGATEKNGDLFSCPATVSIKVQQRSTGKILSLDLERGSAADVGEPTTARKALENAADGLAERLIPLLTKSATFGEAGGLK